MRLGSAVKGRDWKISTLILIVLGLLLIGIVAYSVGTGSDGPFLIALLVPGFLISMWVVNRRALFPYIYILVLGLDQLTPETAGGVFTVPKVGAALLLAAYLLNTRRSPRLHSYRVFAPAALLLAYFTATTLWSLNGGGALVRSITFALLLTSFWLVAHFAQELEDVRQFLGALVLFALFASIMAVLEFAAQYNAGGLGLYIRADSITGNANDSAFSIALGMLVLIGLRMRGLPGWPWLSTRWHIPVVALGVTALLMTGSRGGLLAFAVGFVFLVALTGISWRNGLRLIVIIGGVALALPVVNQTLPILDNFNQRLVVPLQSGIDITSGRLDIWEAALDEVSDSALGGYGLSSSTAVGAERPTHNSFLWALLEGGVIGFGIWCLLLISAGWALWQVRKQARRTKNPNAESLSVVLLALLGCGIAMALSSDVEYHKQLWLILALAEAVYGICRATQKEIQRG